MKVCDKFNDVSPRPMWIVIIWLFLNVRKIWFSLILVLIEYTSQWEFM